MRDLTVDIHHADSGAVASVPKRQVPVLVKNGWVVSDPSDPDAPDDAAPVVAEPVADSDDDTDKSEEDYA